ncbi:MAG: PAS domain S-box protein, partial [Deltaproteobacteria bacterium]|nr:PAS domain S-box protein [Deltaproteobacteria bacterium]
CFRKFTEQAAGTVRAPDRIRRGLSPYRDAQMVIGLRMTGFSAARHEDMQHAFIMASILIVLGGGTIFFIYVIQRYQRMNRVLKETRDYTDLVVDSMANGLLSIDSTGRVLSCNRHALELLGIRAEDPKEILLDRVLDFDACGISETLSDCVPVYDREVTLPEADGLARILSLSVTPILENKECGGAVLMLRDLTEIKELEQKVQRAEKFAALGKLAAAVAHEIRNPLSSIRGFARFLSRQLKDRPEDREYADIMVREVDRINRVVTDLLNFARPLELTLSPVSPQELLAHPLNLVKGDAASRGILIHEHASGDTTPVLLDSNLLTHALLNLLLNALSASGQGGEVDVGVSVEQNRFSDQGRSMVRFIVEDNGPGIPPEHMEKIFDPFFTTRENGTGLGLAIVHKFVEMHHGAIRVESPVYGKTGGCRFTLELPAQLATS